MTSDPDEYAKRVRQICGDHDGDTYLRIARRAEALLKSLLEVQSENKNPGRPSKDRPIVSQVRDEIINLLKECNAAMVPPPATLVEALGESWEVKANQNQRVTSLRSEKRKKAIKAEALMLGIGNDLRLAYRRPIKRVAVESGADRKTIREWRQQDDYCRAVLDEWIEQRPPPKPL